MHSRYVQNQAPSSHTASSIVPVVLLVRSRPSTPYRRPPTRARTSSPYSCQVTPVLPYSFRAGSSKADVLPRCGLNIVRGSSPWVRTCRGWCTRPQLGTTPVSRETRPGPGAAKGTGRVGSDFKDWTRQAPAPTYRCALRHQRFPSAMKQRPLVAPDKRPVKQRTSWTGASQGRNASRSRRTSSRMGSKHQATGSPGDSRSLFHVKQRAHCFT